MTTPPHESTSTIALIAYGVLVAMSFLAMSLLGQDRSAKPTRRLAWPTVVATIAALACTALSAQASWRFADHYLGMHNAIERGAFFATGQLAMIACALVAHRDAREARRTAGVPRAMIWLIAAALTIPTYAEFGPALGTAHALFGPWMAAVLWHQIATMPPRLSS